MHGVRLVPVPPHSSFSYQRSKGLAPALQRPAACLLETARRGWEAPVPSPGSWEDVIGEAGD